jgi:hypothetical protein
MKNLFTNKLSFKIAAAALLTIPVNNAIAQTQAEAAK